MSRPAFLLACLLFSLIARPSVAQEQKRLPDNPALAYENEGRIDFSTDMSFMYDPEFDFLVRVVYLTWPQKFDFLALRKAYMKTSQYDPIPETVIGQMMERAYALENAETEEEKARIGAAFEDIALTHLANMDVILTALSFARDDKKFGDPAFYEWVRDNIIRDIMSRSDGKSIADPFEVITMAEENALLSALKLRPVYTEMLSNGEDFYNIHLVEDIKTGEKSELYTNISVPMRFLKKQYKAAQTQTSRSLGILRQ